MRDKIDPWEESSFACAKCGWSGQGRELEQGELAREGCERLCPKCGDLVLWLEFPTLEELAPHFDKLSAEEQKHYLAQRAGHEAWNREKLSRPEQLPEIDARYIVLLWDFDVATEQIVIRHGSEVIFRQRTSWEYWRYFIQACGVLKTKYGHRLLDVIPTPGTETDIGGDSYHGLQQSRKMRKLIAEDCYAEPYDQLLKRDRSQGWKDFLKEHSIGRG